MSSDLTKYVGNKIVRWFGGSAMPPAPASLYLALFNGDPRESGVEVTTDVRSAGRLAGVWTVPASNDTDNELVNSGDMNFGNSEGDADISHGALFDAATGGNMLSAKPLPAAVSVTSGNAVKFSAGKVRFTIGS